MYPGATKDPAARKLSAKLLLFFFFSGGRGWTIPGAVPCGGWGRNCFHGRVFLWRGGLWRLSLHWRLALRGGLPFRRLCGWGWGLHAGGLPCDVV